MHITNMSMQCSLVPCATLQHETKLADNMHENSTTSIQNAQ